ncbi:hypothetical protein SH1V18_03300 [Vallitalea longa]|uniref:Uncharacterized protein n=1 Tax=Vallitalea longa TaxID=2936439 RepID=A0A9W5Y777_9FIRM|nr:hypothetical protein [Vallitalea longa]GKX27850.1 hypothetical protein SH1V18_03300 [Vallitalea longa]
MNRVNEVSKKEELTALKRNELMSILMDYKDKGIDLPADWSKMSNEEFIETIINNEKNYVEAIKKTDQNPFNEEIIETVIPVDQLNPKMKVVQVTVNFKPLMFPVGKKAKMPKSYHDVYMNSQDKDTQTAMKLQENRMKEI